MGLETNTANGCPSWSARAAALAALTVLLTGCATVSTDAGGPTFWTATEALTPGQRFELAKRSRPELIAFLRRFPKGADLHNHAGGATYSDYLLDGARAAGWVYDPVAITFVPTARDDTMTVDALEQDAAELTRFFEALSMRGWYPNTTSGHDHFFQTFGHITPSGRTPADLLAELVPRNRYQNVNYLELMFNPLPHSLRAEFVQTGAGLDPNDLDAAFTRFEALIASDGVARGITDSLDALDAAVESRLQLGVPVSDAAGAPVHVRYIGSLHRGAPLDVFFSNAVAIFAGMQADERIVGLNIVAPEDHPRARRNFETQMRMLDYLWRKFDSPNVTLHAGELTLTLSPVESMWDRIRSSIDVGHARRIGHGVSIGWEKDLPSLLEQMRRDGVLVEINLSSNESILGIAGDDHPLPLFLQAEVPVCLTTDDEGVSRSNLTAEYVKAARRYELDYAALKRMSRNCLEYAFLPGESLFIDRDFSQLRPGFANLATPEWTPDAAATALIESHPKLARQVLLERASVGFEAALSNGFGEAR